MKSCFIKDIKWGITKGGFCCGPYPGNVVVGINYNDGVKDKWIYNVEVEGMYTISLTDVDCFDILLEEDFDNPEFIKYAKDCVIESFEGYDLSNGDYDDLEQVLDLETKEGKLLKLLLDVTRFDEQTTNKIINEVKNTSL